MSSQESFDLAVLGGGSAGYAAALRGAELGLKVAIIEQDKIGGTCLHQGCIPTKALLHSAAVADAVRGAHKFGIEASLGSIDLLQVAKHKKSVVDGLFRGLSGLLAGRGIATINGTGRIASANSIEVRTDGGELRTVTARHLLIATGSVPKSIPEVTVDHRTVITSDDALTLDYTPSRVVVLGGGAIGCEFATIWRSFGAEVTIVEALPHLVPLEEEAASRALEKAFKRQGITAELGSQVAAVRRADDHAEVELASGRTLTADLVLVAIGRSPRTAELGLEDVGIQVDRGYIKVDEHCRTSVPNIYAAGDVIATPQLAHVGFAEGILVAETLAGGAPEPIDYIGIPRITYSHPEVASVGLTSAAATAKGFEVEDATYDLAGNGKARILGTSGLVKVVAAKDGPVLGVHMVGDRVGELVSEAQLIVNWDARPEEVAQHIHAHPTLSEAVGEAHLALAGKPLHMHD